MSVGAVLPRGAGGLRADLHPPRGAGAERSPSGVLARDPQRARAGQARARVRAPGRAGPGRAGIILPGRAIASIAVRLPRGIAYATRASVLAGVAVTGPRHARLRYSLRLSAGKLTLILAHPAATVTIAIGSGALLVDQALARLVANRMGKSLTLAVRTVDAGRTRVAQKIKVKAS